MRAQPLGLPVTGDGAGPPGDIPGREGTFPKKLGDIPASSISPTPRRPDGDIPGRRGHPRAASGISPAAHGLPDLERAHGAQRGGIRAGGVCNQSGRMGRYGLPRPPENDLSNGALVEGVRRVGVQHMLGGL